MGSSSTPPLYAVGNTVYIVETAKIGNLESYKIDGIVWNDKISEWTYLINIKRSNDSSLTGQENALGFGDRPGKYTLLFSEQEVADFCTAATYVQIHHTRKLAAINAMIASKCGDTGGTGGTGTN